MANPRSPPSGCNHENSTDSPSRRDVLRATGGLGVTVVTGLAGCAASSSSKPTYHLSTRRVVGSLADIFRWKSGGRFAAENRELMKRLTEGGAMTTVGFSLASSREDYPPYAEHDGTYYRISVEETGEVERKHWIFWFDLLEGKPPSDAEVYSSSLGLGEQTDLAAEYGLSELDVRVTEDVAGEIPREFGFHDPEEDPLEQRGHVFVRRSVDETDLVLEPPFTHVAFETDDETHYARAITERATVPLQQYRHTAEPVADSAADYAEYVRERHRRTTFDRETLAAEKRTILDEATGYRPPEERPTADASGGIAVSSNTGYEERSPLSDAMKAVLERLEFGGVETPESGGVAFSDDAYFEYGDLQFTGQLEILR